MSILKTAGIIGIVGLAFGTGVWWAGKSGSEPAKTAEAVSAPQATAKLVPPPEAPLPDTKPAPMPAAPPSGDPLADSFGRQLPAIDGDVPVPDELKGKKGLLSRQQMEKARELMNQIGPDTLRFLRDDLRLADRDIQAVAEAQRDMDQSMVAFAEQSRGQDPSAMNERMKTAFTAYTEKLEGTMGRENTQRFHQFRSGQFRRIAEQSGLPAPPSL